MEVVQQDNANISQSVTELKIFGPRKILYHKEIEVLLFIPPHPCSIVVPPLCQALFMVCVISFNL